MSKIWHSDFEMGLENVLLCLSFLVSMQRQELLQNSHEPISSPVLLASYPQAYRRFSGVLQAFLKSPAGVSQGSCRRFSGF